jgi:peptidoglycan/xylan/chitin deacetylase (PgdA/CDA1 family)
MLSAPRLMPCAVHRDRDAVVLTISVDCDGLADYLNFAPAGTQVGSDRITYPVLVTRLLELFERHGIRATFFCVGAALKRDPVAAGVMRQAVAAGHAVGNHSYSHPDMARCDVLEQRAQVVDGHAAIVETIGVVPRGYRGPAYHLSETTLEALAALGYHYDSSACPAKFLGVALRILGYLRPDYRRKDPAGLQRLFRSDAPVMLQFHGGGQLLEWPIPIAYGLAFYGTFHALAPRWVFNAQYHRLTSRSHIHYELHPIEVLDRATADRYPWLPTATAVLRRGRDLVAWLDERLAQLAHGRVVTTLEELSADHSPVRHR